MLKMLELDLFFFHFFFFLVAPSPQTTFAVVCLKEALCFNQGRSQLGEARSSPSRAAWFGSVGSWLHVATRTVLDGKLQTFTCSPDCKDVTRTFFKDSRSWVLELG